MLIDRAALLRGFGQVAGDVGCKLIEVWGDGRCHAGCKGRRNTEGNCLEVRTRSEAKCKGTGGPVTNPGK